MSDEAKIGAISIMLISCLGLPVCIIALNAASGWFEPLSMWVAGCMLFGMLLTGLIIAADYKRSK